MAQSIGLGAHALGWSPALPLQAVWPWASHVATQASLTKQGC